MLNPSRKGGGGVASGGGPRRAQSQLSRCLSLSLSSPPSIYLFLLPSCTMDSSAEKHSTTHAENTGARFALPEDDEQLRNTVTMDTEKGTDASSAYANSTIGLEMRAERKKSERKLLLKLDVVILPLAFFLYLSAYLDRGNLGK